MLNSELTKNAERAETAKREIPPHITITLQKIAAVTATDAEMRYWAAGGSFVEAEAHGARVYERELANLHRARLSRHKQKRAG